MARTKKIALHEKPHLLKGFNGEEGLMFDNTLGLQHGISSNRGTGS